MYLFIFWIIASIAIGYLGKKKKIGFTLALILSLINPILGIIVTLISKEKNNSENEENASVNTFSNTNEFPKNQYGTCDFCEKETKLYAARIYSIYPKNKIPIAIFYRCIRCSFWHVVRPILLILVLIISMYVLACSGLPIGVFAVFITFGITIKHIYPYLNKKIGLKNIGHLLFERKLTAEVPVEDLYERNYKINHDGKKMIALLFGTFLFPAIVIMIIQNISNKQLDESFNAHRRLGVGYAGKSSSHIEYNYKSHDYKITTELSINKRSEADTLFQYGSQIFGEKYDTCSSYDPSGYTNGDSLLQLILKEAKYIPVVYDATNKSNGHMLLTKYDYQKFGYDKETLNDILGIDTSSWNNYKKLYQLIEIYQFKGRCSLFDSLFSKPINDSMIGNK